MGWTNLCTGRAFISARNSANAGVVQQRRRCSLGAKSLKINKRFNAGVATVALQNRGLQVRFLPGLFALPRLTREGSIADGLRNDIPEASCPLGQRRDLPAVRFAALSSIHPIV